MDVRVYVLGGGDRMKIVIIMLVPILCRSF